MNSWTLYYDTLDFPGLYVARRFTMTDPTPEYFASSNVGEVRDWIWLSAKVHGVIPFCVRRFPDDDPKIIETWF